MKEDFQQYRCSNNSIYTECMATIAGWTSIRSYHTGERQPDPVVNSATCIGTVCSFYYATRLFHYQHIIWHSANRIHHKGLETGYTIKEDLLRYRCSNISIYTELMATIARWTSVRSYHTGELQPGPVVNSAACIGMVCFDIWHTTNRIHHKGMQTGYTIMEDFLQYRCSNNSIYTESRATISRWTSRRLIHLCTLT